MVPSTGISEAVEAQNTIKVLDQRLKEAAQQLSIFKVDFDVSIDTSTLDIKVIAAKPYGGGGFIRTIPHTDAVYYANDIDSLADEIVEQVFTVLLKSVLKTNLTPSLKAAVINSAKIGEKK
jgi:hypothetical protein